MYDEQENLEAEEAEEAFMTIEEIEQRIPQLQAAIGEGEYQLGGLLLRAKQMIANFEGWIKKFGISKKKADRLIWFAKMVQQVEDVTAGDANIKPEQLLIRETQARCFKQRAHYSRETVKAIWYKALEYANGM